MCALAWPGMVRFSLPLSLPQTHTHTLFFHILFSPFLWILPPPNACELFIAVRQAFDVCMTIGSAFKLAEQDMRVRSGNPFLPLTADREAVQACLSVHAGVGFVCQCRLREANSCESKRTSLSKLRV